MPHPTPAFLPLLPLPRALKSPRWCTTITARATYPPSNGLPNFRDIASAAPKLIRSGLVYRGATPASLPPHPSHESVTFLHNTPVLLDLRSRDERASDKVAQLVAVCGEDFFQREIHVSLLNKRKIVYGLARALPIDQTRALFRHALLNPTKARKAIVGRMDEGGLMLLNKILVDVGARGIGRALRVITDGVSAKGRGPVYFYCSAGKDRTGLLAALILSVLGASRTDIIRDYARSSETWENGPYELRRDYCCMLSLMEALHCLCNCFAASFVLLQLTRLCVNSMRALCT